MGSFTKGHVILVPFPFSDLSNAKLRPAVILASIAHKDYILCQITSNPYADPLAQKLDDSSFINGSLSRISFARPSKLFTANQDLIVSTIGKLNQQTIKLIIEKIVHVLTA